MTCTGSVIQALHHSDIPSIQADTSADAALQDRIRAQHRELLRIARRVHPVPKVLEYLAQGITSKSSRTRVENTEALGEVLAEEGLTVFERTREKPFPAIAQARLPSIRCPSCAWQSVFLCQRQQA